MRILITGSNGFVGQHLSRALAEAGHSVVTTGTETSARNSDYPYVQADLTKRKDVERLNFTEIDGVVHLAGLAAVGPSFDDPQLYIDVNMGAQINIFETILAQGAKPRVIVVSSGTLYDPKARLPLTELSSVMPNSPYAVSKMGQEQLGQYYFSRGIECIIARPFNHIGPGQGEGFLLPDLAKQIVQAEQGGNATILVGNLSAKRDYTDVRDIVRGYILLLTSGQPGENYNICSGQAIEGNEILNHFRQLSRHEISVESDSTRMRPSDTPVIYGSYAKINKDTGWVPTIPLEDTLRDVLEDWRDRFIKEA